MIEDDLLDEADEDPLPELVKEALEKRNRRQDSGIPYGDPRSVVSFCYVEDGQDLELARLDGPLPVPLVGEAVYLYHMLKPFVVDRVYHSFSQPDGEQVAVTYVILKPSID